MKRSTLENTESGLRSAMKLQACLTNPIERNSSWAANSRSVGQDIPPLLWNQKINYQLPCSQKSATDFNVLYRLLIFQFPNILSLFRFSDRSEKSAQVRRHSWHFVKHHLYGDGLLASCPTSNLQHPLSVVRDCLFNSFAATIHMQISGGRVLYPQAEDAQCRDDMGYMVTRVAIGLKSQQKLAV